MTFRRPHPAAVVAPALIAAILLTGCGNGSAPSPSAPPAPEVSIHTVASEKVTLEAELPGRTAPFLVAEVRPQVGGIIQKRTFEEGSTVTAGQTLYQIDPAPFQATLARAEASLQSARLLSQRYDSLAGSQAISKQAQDEALSAYRQATASAQSARIDLNYTRVNAPISGRVGRSTVTQGALVSASQGQALSTIQQLDPIYVDIVQPSTEVLRLKEEIAAGTLSINAEGASEVSLVLENGKPYAHRGTLKFSEVTVDPGTGAVTLRALFPNPDSLLLPGMFVRASLHEGTRPDAILVPQRAITRDTQGQAVVLTVDEKSVVHQAKVRVERAIGDKWLISEGLKVGDRLITDGRQNAIPGKTVSVTPADKASPSAAAAE